MTTLLAILVAFVAQAAGRPQSPPSPDAKAIIATAPVIALTHVNVIDGTGAPAVAALESYMKNRILIRVTTST